MYQWTCDFSSRSLANPLLTSCEPPPSDTSLLSPPHLLRLLSSRHPENDGQAGQREGFASFPFLATSPHLLFFREWCKERIPATPDTFSSDTQFFSFTVASAR